MLRSCPPTLSNTARELQKPCLRKVEFRLRPGLASFQSSWNLPLSPFLPIDMWGWGGESPAECKQKLVKTHEQKKFEERRYLGGLSEDTR